MAADPHTRPTDLGCESACRLLYGLHTSSPFYYYQLESRYSFYCPTECRSAAAIKRPVATVGVVIHNLKFSGDIAAISEYGHDLQLIMWIRHGTRKLGHDINMEKIEDGRKNNWSTTIS